MHKFDTLSEHRTHCEGDFSFACAELYVYEGAGHAFNNDTRPAYRPESAKLAYSRSLDWFAKYFK